MRLKKSLEFTDGGRESVAVFDIMLRRTGECRYSIV